MDVSGMRRADRWLGVPACLALSFLRRLSRPDADTDRPAPPRRILFIKLAEQGSTVLAYPALRRAVQRVGRENVFFLVFQENRFILDVMNVIPAENVIAIPTGNLMTTVRGAMDAIERMRREKIDTAIDLEFFARSSAALAYLSGARHRVGFHAWGGEAAYRGDLMTHRLSFNSHLHTSQVFAMMVEALDQPPAQFPAFDAPPPAADELPPAFQCGVEEREQVTALVMKEMRALPPSPLPPLILLNANCSDLLPLRRWPTERYVELARRVIGRDPDACIVFTGAPDEAPAARRLVDQINSPRCVSLAGKTTLRQLMVLYTLAQVLVTNDSGPAHFAALTPIDVITLFGPETPRLFAARTPPPRNTVLWAGLACSPCVNAYNDRRSACRNNICMQRITVDQVFEKVCAALGRRQA